MHAGCKTNITKVIASSLPGMMIAFMLVMLFLLFSETSAFCGSKDEKATLEARTHAQLSKKEEVRFLTLTEKRNKLLQQIQAISIMMEEKVSERGAIGRLLKKKFQIDPDGSYQYDEDDRVIYLLSTDTESIQKDLHIELTQREARTFKRMVHVKQSIDQALQGLEILAKQKKRQWDDLYQDLLEDFEIHRDLNYHYDRESRTLYRLQAGDDA